MLHVISLAQFATAYTRGWAAQAVLALRAAARTTRRVCLNRQTLLESGTAQVRLHDQFFLL
jgi:hypothetical protein